MSAAALPKRVGGLSILYVMAAPAEYGAALQARITPLMTGIGPVEGAVVLSSALAALSARNALPDLVVSLGSAGSRHLAQSEVVQIASVSWRDMDASALGFERGRTPLLDLPAEVVLPHRIPDFPTARISTGGNVVSGAGYDAIDADLVDMETWAHMRAADHFGLPLIGLRGISDGAEDLRGYSDWTALLHVVDEKLAFAVDRLEAALLAGQITL